MFKNKKFVTIGIIVLIVLIIILAVLKKKGAIGSKDAVNISTELVKKRSITETVSANGKIQPVTEVKISPDVSGEIIDLPVKEGEQVKQGQLLARIKPDNYITGLERMEAALNNSIASLANSKARFAQSNAQFTNAKASFDRNDKLWKQQVISASDYDAARSAYEVAKADVDAAKETVKSAEYTVRSAESSVKEAKENLTKTSIFAPLDGTISSLKVKKGERVVGTSQFTGTEMMIISDLDAMEVDADVNENDIVRVHKGDTAIIEVDAYLSRRFKGIVNEIANSASNTATTSADQVTNFTVKIIILKNSYKDLLSEQNSSISPFRPGMSASVDILTKKVFNVLTVPVQAVTTRIDTTKDAEKAITKPASNEGEAQKVNNVQKVNEIQEFVFIYEKGAVKRQNVKTGIQDNTYIEIKEGLKDNQEIVTAPYRAISKELKDGDKVKKIDKKDLFVK